MAEFVPPKKKGGRKKPVEESPKPNRLPAVAAKKIEEARCHVCKSPFRDAIDRQLAISRPYKEIERIFSTDDYKIDSRSIANHAEKHLGYEDAAVRLLITKEAEQAEEDVEFGISTAVQRRVFLDAAIQQGLDDLTNNILEFEAKDLVKMIELRERLEKDTSAAATETLWVQFHAFRQAMLEKVPQEYYPVVLERAKEIAASAGKGEIPPSPDLPPELNP